MKPDAIVDARATFCPVPILELAKKLRGLADGAIVELLATDPAVESDVQAFAASTGHELVWLRAEAGAWTAGIRVRRSPGLA